MTSEQPIVDHLPQEKTVPFEDTFLTIKHYKEPLKAIPRGEGYGYYGALMCTTDGKGVQCHVCGNIFLSLSGHLVKHKMNVRQYREKFELAYTTALISEQERIRLQQKTLDWIGTLTPEQKQEFSARARAHLALRHGTGTTGKTLRLESHNKRGTCPDQLLAKIQDVATTLGHTPSKAEFITACGTQRYVHLIYKVYGSWKTALLELELDVRSQTGVKRGKKKTYTREDLLDYLRLFTQEHGRIPTQTDFHRDFLPSYSTYLKHFKSIEDARQAAGVYDFIDIKNVHPRRPKTYGSMDWRVT